jgi:hypothetical protein
MPKQTYIFGYGSLVSPADVYRTLGRAVDMYPAVLQGWVRDWSVAVDNQAMRRSFVRLDDGSMPSQVLALNVRQPASGEAPTNPNGVLFAVSPADLVALDARETCYQKIDVSDTILAPVTGTIYTYTGFEQYLYTYDDLQRSIVPESYLKVVKNGFLAWGNDAYEQFLASTVPSPCAVVPTKLITNSDWVDTQKSRQPALRHLQTPA